MDNYDTAGACQKIADMAMALLEKRLDILSADIKQLTIQVHGHLMEAAENKAKVNGLLTLRNWLAALLIPLVAAGTVTLFLNITANTRAIDRMERSLPAPPASTLVQPK